MKSLIAASASPVAMLGTSPAARQIRDQAESLSRQTDCVLICGAPGTGKESLARAIHAGSARNGKPFISLNCPLLSAGSFFDSQVFGHLPGAFAGLKTSSLGLIQSANGGTLFLRNVESLELESQWKLLRTIQEQSVVPLGGSEAIPVDIRVIASTSADLQLGASVGMFRHDFYTLLSANVVEMKKLADRLEDLPALADEISREVAARQKQLFKPLDESAREWMSRYEWPGNLSELRQAIDLAVKASKTDSIDARSLRTAMKKIHVRTTSFEQAVAPARFTGFAATRLSESPRCRSSATRS